MRSLPRREFLRSTVTTGLALAGISSLSSESAVSAQKSKKPRKKDRTNDASSMAIIDTHQHLWDLQRFELPWTSGPEVASLRRSFLPSDYAVATEGLCVVKTIYMEVDVVESQRHAEAEYVIDLCERGETPMVGAVICGPVGTGEFAEYFDRYKSNKYVKGVRRVLHSSATPAGYCLKPEFIKDMQLLGELGKSYDFCLRAPEMPDAIPVVEACPETRFIVDHCGNLPVGNKDEKVYEAWKRGMAGLAKHDRVYCKISGIVASAKKGAWTPDDLAPTINTCAELFGKDRIMFAGDWPVCTLGADSFAHWLNALQEIVKDWPLEDQRKLFHDNAVKFYGLA